MSSTIGDKGTANPAIVHGAYVPGDGDAHTEQLTSSFILEFARLQAALIDSYMNGKLTAIGVAKAEVDQLNNISALLAQYAGQERAEGADYDQIRGTIEAAVRDEKEGGLPNNSPAKRQLQQMLGDERGVLNTNTQGGTDRILGKADIESLNKTIGSLEKDSEQRAQDASLVFQQKMGERGNLFSQCSELLRDLNETAKGIIANGR
jgi:hypothetical protein